MVNTGDIDQEWSQDGTFFDKNGRAVRAYDDVRILVDAEAQQLGHSPTLVLPAGTTGTVLFYSTGDPCYLDVEFEVPGMAVGVVKASDVEYFLSSEAKYPR